MKDLHSHILYGIDDGSDSLEESIKLLKEMKKSGYNEIVLTPHYIENSKYNCNNNDKNEIKKELEEKIKEENIDITLYLGNEVFVTNNFIELIEKKEIATINNSKYILFELPMKSRYTHTLELMSKLLASGYVPILAHPERYEFLRDKPKMVEEYLRAGILLQGNVTSLFGKYGRKEKKALKLFIKNHWISFLGSDTHHNINIDEKKVRKILYKLTKDEEYIEDLLNNNFDKVINNKDIAMVR